MTISHHKLIRQITLALLLYVTSPLIALANQIESFPGGFVKVPLQDEEPLYLNQDKLLVIQDGTGSFALVGIPIEQRPGTIYVDKLINGQYTRFLAIKVVDKEYPSESITIRAKSKVKPPVQKMDRIHKERELLNKAFANWTYKPLSEVSLNQPVQGRFSGEFGTRRVYNGELKSQHRGIDIAAPIGTPVKASAIGTVTLSKDLYYTGNTVVIDHGQGWQTVYCHLDRIDVRLNQQVTEATVIGTVGQTGRATGPHLHFGMILNQARVDPGLFWKLNN